MYHCLLITSWLACEKCTFLTKTCLIVFIGICKVKVALELSVIELYGDSVMSVLIHSPDEAEQVQA